MNIRSLGGLRPNLKKNQEKQPDYLGRMFMSRENFMDIVKAFDEKPGEHLELGLAGWTNEKKSKFGIDRYLTVEIRPLTKDQTPMYKPTDEENIIANLEEFFQ